jgi:hypothetical protein
MQYCIDLPMKMELIEGSETSAINTQTSGKHLQYCIDLPMKMEPIEGSETSAISTETSGKHPKENILRIKHGESLKSRTATRFSGELAVRI